MPLIVLEDAAGTDKRGGRTEPAMGFGWQLGAGKASGAV
jgi:hypothetical protein